MALSKTLLLITFGALLVCTGCKGKDSMYPNPISSKDKELDCEHIKLEINDAEYVKRQASRNRGLKMRNVLWPFGYPATYMNSSDAITKANERIEYLQEISKIKGCDAALIDQL